MSYFEQLSNTPISRREFLVAGAVLAMNGWSWGTAGAASQEQSEGELEASYSYTFEAVTNENKEASYPDYDIGENIATITVSKNGESYPRVPRIQASIGMNWLMGEVGTNSVNTTWFKDGIFDQDSFTKHIVEPVIESISNFLDDVSTTTAIVNLPTGRYGETDSYSNCNEQKQAILRIDTQFVNNPASEKWSELPIEERALLDRTTIFAPAHEAFHVKLGSLGVPPNLVGEEALASGYGRHILNTSRHLWHTEISGAVIKADSNRSFFEHSNLTMQGTGSDHPYAGYEHDMLPEWLLSSNGHDWDWLTEQIDMVTHEEQTLACPIVPYVNALSRVFNEMPWEEILGHYLGEVLKSPPAAKHYEIFYLVRQDLPDHLTEIGVYSPIELTPNYFSYHKYIHLLSDRHPIFSSDGGLIVSVVGQDGNTQVLKNGADLTSFLTEENGQKIIKMAVLNPTKQPARAEIIPVVYDETLSIPQVKKSAPLDSN